MLEVARRAPGRTTNAGSGRTREYLIPGEVDRLASSPKSAAAYDNRDALAPHPFVRTGQLINSRNSARGSGPHASGWPPFDAIRFTLSTPSPLLLHGGRQLRRL
jgi:hypothetical protein